MKQEGDRKICHDCDVEIHVEKRNDSFGERLSWRNADGSAHFTIEEGQLVHTPTKTTKHDIWRQEIEDRLERIEKELGIVRVE